MWINVLLKRSAVDDIGHSWTLLLLSLLIVSPLPCLRTAWRHQRPPPKRKMFHFLLFLLLPELGVKKRRSARAWFQFSLLSSPCVTRHQNATKLTQRKKTNKYKSYFETNGHRLSFNHLPLCVGAYRAIKQVMSRHGLFTKTFEFYQKTKIT